MLKNNKQLFVYPPMMALAMYATLLGFMVPQLIEVFGLNYAKVGLFSTIQAVGMVVSLILCFCIFSGLNSIKISSIAMFFFALLMVLFGLNTSVIAAYFMFFFIGLTQNTIDALSNTVISETAKRNISFYTGLMHGLWAFAGAVGPFLAIAVGGGYAQAFVWLGVFMAASTLLFTFGLWDRFKMPMVQNRANVGGVLKLFKLFKRKGMTTLVLLNIFSCLVQNTYIIYISDYIKKTYSFELGGAIVLGSLFFGFLVGRTLFSMVATKISIMKTIAILNALAMIAFVGVFLSQSLVLTAVLMFIGCCLTGMNFPALVLESHKIVPKDVSAASSLIYFGLAVAIFAAPPLIGLMADGLGLRWALLITAAGLVPVVLLSVMSYKYFDSLQLKNS